MGIQGEGYPRGWVSRGKGILGGGIQGEGYPRGWVSRGKGILGGGYPGGRVSGG